MKTNRKRNFLQIVSLCLRSRCPVCASGHLFLPIQRVQTFAELFLPPAHCDRCGFRFRREPGYYFGILTPVLPIVALGIGLLFVGLSYAISRPESPLELLGPGAFGTALGFVLGFRPAIAIFVSFDHAIDPPIAGAESKALDNTPS